MKKRVRILEWKEWLNGDSVVRIDAGKSMEMRTSEPNGFEWFGRIPVEMRSAVILGCMMSMKCLNSDLRALKESLQEDLKEEELITV